MLMCKITNFLEMFMGLVEFWAKLDWPICCGWCIYG